MITTGIIGLGKVGRTLAKAFADKHCLLWTFSVSFGQKEFIDGIQNLTDFNEIKSIPDIIFITKNDAFISATATKLSNVLGKLLNDKIIIHTSGTQPVSVMSILETNGAITGSAHPYQTFHSEDPGILKGIAWSVCLKQKFNTFATFISDTGGNPIDTTKLENYNRNIYHASAIIASNYLNTVAYYAKKTAELAGIDAKEYLPAILQTTLDNIIRSIRNGGQMPLTGPIIRMETETLLLHIDNLKDYPDLLRFYNIMAEQTVRAALADNMITQEQFDKLIGIFLESAN